MAMLVLRGFGFGDCPAKPGGEPRRRRGEPPASRAYRSPSKNVRESKTFGRKVPRGCRSGSGVLLGSGFEFDLRVMPALPQKNFYL